jgi:glyoxylase-like metal-dependent hydrolase (beta-lactamase superfamily II)
MKKSTPNAISLLVPKVAEFFDQDTNTFSYVVSDPTTNACAVIDSVWNLDYASGGLASYSADNILGYIESRDLDIEWIIETHVHADHISAASYIKEAVGGKIAISAEINSVQQVFAKVFNEGHDFLCDGSQFDHLFKDNESYKIGNLEAVALLTPGHTPACMTHVIGDSAFVGDTLFMPEGGTARADFPGGCAGQLYDSIQKILALPDETRLFMCHDYSVERPDLAFESSVLEERKNNIHVNDKITKSEFVVMREARDKTLDMPRYILPSLQINMHAGHLPDPEGNGLSYLKIPINAFK